MPLYKDYGFVNLLGPISRAHNAEAATTSEVSIAGYEDLLMFYDATIAFTGGSTPGVRFTLELEVNGDGEWVAVETLITTNNGFPVAAPAVLTVTSTGKYYRKYTGLACTKARVKIENTGSPTGGTATINKVSLSGRA